MLLDSPLCIFLALKDRVTSETQDKTRPSSKWLVLPVLVSAQQGCLPVPPGGWD